jgi:hypothetical protein
VGVERRSGEQWSETAFFAEAKARSAASVAGLRALLESALSFEGALDLVWGAGDQKPRFMVRRAGTRSGDLLSGWASGGIDVQVGALHELLGKGDRALKDLSTALGLPGWLEAKEPSFDAALLERVEVKAAVDRLLAAIGARRSPSHSSEGEFDRNPRTGGASAAPSTWLLLTFGDERQYAENQGYDDDPARVYRYDSFAPHHRQIVVGDSAVLKAPGRTLGCARIERIEQQEGTKERQRCPACRTTAIKSRRSANPRYRCDSGHEFEDPLTEQVPCRKFAAHFGDSFVPLPADVQASALRAACQNYNGQLAMQRIDRVLIAESIPLTVLNEALAKIDGTRSADLKPDDAALTASEPTGPDPSLPYAPTGLDTREAVMRQLRARRGQTSFRQQLRATHGDACMVTGCRLIDLLEAAHISPYRGDSDVTVRSSTEGGHHRRAIAAVLGGRPVRMCLPGTSDRAVARRCRDWGATRCARGRPQRIRSD